MDTVHQLEIQPGMSIEALVRGWSHCGFGARRLAQAAEIYERMLSEDFTKFFTLSGAMVPAGMRHVVSDLIRGGHVDVLVSTGANLVHDIIESFGCHSLGCAESDDSSLRAQGVSRIYDVFIRDQDFEAFEELMQSILPESSQAISGRQLLNILGSRIADRRSILRSAYDMEVPVFCPALPDSMIGLQAWMFSQTKKLSVDAFADIREIIDICYNCERAGVVIVGGGVPKNFTLQSMLVTPNSFDLAIQLTTDTPENGGLSGATLSEAVSWGKISQSASHVTVYGDATITLPLMVGAALGRLKK
ncbi:MAG TPA: deoxyhypusine synthase [Methanothrix sp.]|jgi:deoxyhypusine synthase|uniref:deoxyhypusine synthase n=1 Tax=Methanothrix sp. TaxID=90426 RepID=UPI002C0D0376|nr:deoxyhypusine synthase [Methanothrix sp.]MDI9417823.1 deoxyhypusine synthase [Euryarchaeota archaeon]HON36313.1 deoxyhypusine synthase [Methanothrix sp.]HRU75328.1 deoxyhypusine synthase [Methanothrix sp.]